MILSQDDKLAILAMTGNNSDDEGQEPLPPAPLFDYNAYRDRINGYAPPAPRNYIPEHESDEMPDMGEDEDEETLESLLRAFSIDKQGREYSGDVLPSARSRGAIRSELASMGCNWGE